MKQFSLYPFPEKPTFNLADYAMLASLAYGRKSVLEIGPGISTFALIEAGVERIVTLEHTDEWFERAKNSLKDHPQVEVRRYKDEPEATAELGEEIFDMAFVDSPKGFTKPVKGIEGLRKPHPGQMDCSRFNTCMLALKHAPVVYLHDAYRPLERCTAGRLSSMGHKVEYVPNAKQGLLKITRKDQTTGEFADMTGTARTIIWPKRDKNWSTGLSKT